MRNLLLIALFFFSIATVNAQMDDKFYYPKKLKTIQIDSLTYKERSFIIDKDTLNSIIILAKNNPAKALILYFHGAGGNLINYVKYIKPLVNNNYDVMMIDLRGYGKSTGKPTHISNSTDAQFILNAIVTDKTFGNKKIIVYGASMGTQVATHLAKNNQDKITALVLDGTISSFTDIALDKTPKAQHTIINQYVTSPYAAKEDIKEIKKMPVLFIHSKTDKDVPYSQAEIVYANAKTKKFLWIYEGNHLMAPIVNSLDFIKNVDNLLQ